jgi:hypothetical protein
MGREEEEIMSKHLNDADLTMLRARTRTIFFQYEDEFHNYIQSLCVVIFQYFMGRITKDTLQFLVNDLSFIVDIDVTIVSRSTTANSIANMAIALQGYFVLDCECEDNIVTIKLKPSLRVYEKPNLIFSRDLDEEDEAPEASM